MYSKRFTPYRVILGLQLVRHPQGGGRPLQGRLLRPPRQDVQVSYNCLILKKARVLINMKIK